MRSPRPTSGAESELAAGDPAIAIGVGGVGVYGARSPGSWARRCSRWTSTTGS
ncbi:MAG: hypothetical protein IPP83_11170 [Flavobacteriales bacterium]|nr:hypothetical protein [Flavobacteriales bacterium]